ncbi:MAG: hypothetical protein V4490_07355 [Pseudomonadota bacterium]
MANVQKKSQGQALVALVHQSMELAVQQTFPKSEPAKDANPLLLALRDVHPTLLAIYHELQETTPSKSAQSTLISQPADDKHA